LHRVSRAVASDGKGCAPRLVSTCPERAVRKFFGLRLHACWPLALMRSEGESRRVASGDSREKGQA
jgi:hypothetical protein